MYITGSVGARFLCVCFGKGEKRRAPGPTDNIHKMPHEALPIKYRDLPSAARNQTGTFQLPGSIRDGWPLDTKHFGEQVLSALLEAVRTVARLARWLLMMRDRGDDATDTRTCSRKAWM